MSSTIPADPDHNAPLAIGLISLTTFGYTGYTANTLAFPADVFPKQAVASVWGLASMGSGFGGMLFMALSGWLIGRFGYTPVFHRLRDPAAAGSVLHFVSDRPIACGRQVSKATG